MFALLHFLPQHMSCHLSANQACMLMLVCAPGTLMKQQMQAGSAGGRGAPWPSQARMLATVASRASPSAAAPLAAPSGRYMMRRCTASLPLAPAWEWLVVLGVVGEMPSDVCR